MLFFFHTGCGKSQLHPKDIYSIDYSPSGKEEMLNKILDKLKLERSVVYTFITNFYTGSIVFCFCFLFWFILQVDSQSL